MTLFFLFTYFACFVMPSSANMLGNADFDSSFGTGMDTNWAFTGPANGQIWWAQEIGPCNGCGTYGARGATWINHAYGGFYQDINLDHEAHYYFRIRNKVEHVTNMIMRIDMQYWGENRIVSPADEDSPLMIMSTTNLADYPGSISTEFSWTNQTAEARYHPPSAVYLRTFVRFSNEAVDARGGATATRWDNAMLYDRNAYYRDREIVEEFSYDPHTSMTNSLSGKDRGGNFTNTWIEETVGHFTVVDASFAQAINYRTHRGNKVMTDPASVSTNIAFRHFAPYTNGTVYAAFIMNYENAETVDGSDQKFVGMSFMSNTTELAFFGEVAGAAARHGIASFGGADKTSSFTLNPGIGNDYILFAKFDFSTDSFYSHAYNLGDTIPLTEPDWGVTGSVPAGRISMINGIRLAAGAGAGTPGESYFDEIYLAPYWIPAGPAGSPDATNLVVGTITDEDIRNGSWTAALYLTNGIGGIESTNVYLGYFKPYYSLNNSDGDTIVTNDSFDSFGYVDAETLVATNDTAPAVGLGGASLGDYRLSFSAISSNYVKQLSKDTYSDGLAITFPVIDDDTDPPVAVGININNGLQLTDQDMLGAQWPLEIVYADASGIYTGGGLGLPDFEANYNVINPAGTTTSTETVWDIVVSSSDGSIHTARDVAVESQVDFTNVLLGTWSIVWSAQDNDNDRLSERSWTNLSSLIQGDSNEFWVVDDDAVPPAAQSNIVLIQDQWTNVNYFEALWDQGYDTYSSVAEYRHSTNVARPASPTDGQPLQGFNTTNSSPAVVYNGDCEIGTNGTLHGFITPTNGWINYGYGTTSIRTDDTVPAHSGTKSLLHVINVHSSYERESRQSQDVYIDNTNNYRVEATLSGWFLGDVSGVAPDFFGDPRTNTAYLGLEFLDAASNRIPFQHVNNQAYDPPSFNGNPLMGKNVTTWSNVVITTHPDNPGPAGAQYVRVMAGLDQAGTGLPITGRWDDLELTVRLVAPGGSEGMLITNALEGTQTNWLFVVDNDSDRPDDAMMSAVTQVVTRLDQTPPALVVITNATEGPDPTSEIVIGWDPLADGGGADLSPWWSYVVYYTDEARPATNTDPYVDLVNGPGDLGNIATRQVTLSNLTDETDYRVTVVGRDRAGNESDIGSAPSYLVSLASFSMTQGVLFVDSEGQPRGNELSWRAATDGGVVIKDYDLIYTDAISFEDSLTNSWKLLATVTDSMVLDTGTSTRTPPTELADKMRFYRAAQTGRWQLTNTPPRASKDIYVMRNLVLSNGHNFVSLFLEPDTNCVSFVLGTNLLPAGGISATSTIVSWYDAAGSDVATNEIWLGDDGHWMWSSGLGGTGVADSKALPLTQGFNIEIPTGGPFRILLLGHIPTNARSHDVQPNQMYNVLGYPEPRTIRVSELGIEDDGFSGGSTRRDSDEIRILSKGVGPLGSPRLRLWYDTDENVWKNYVTGANAMNETIAPDEAIVIYTRKSTSPFTWNMDMHYTPPGKNMNP